MIQNHSLQLNQDFNMNKNDIDWKSFAEQLLWRNIVHDKNEYSGYDIVLDKIPPFLQHIPKEQIYPRGHKPGDIVGDTRLLSYSIGPTKQLSWKELALELNLFEDILLPDNHDCENCPHNKKCNAYFKYDKDQEKCSWWSENMLNIK